MSTSETGRVYLVGAGPGDPGLLTARALELIEQADTILYDRLIPVEALEGARADAELLFVGKEGGGQAMPQEQTEALMVARAREGLSVVRLKGGDPFVFGRGGEEALALLTAGIPFEVVPGVTAGVAAPAYAGIPVTHRGVSTAVALITGHTRADGADGEIALDWPALAAFPGTLVFYMGVSQLPHIAASLIDAGRPSSEPVAVIERGTLPDQRTVIGTLATIAERARAENVRPPSITVVGTVAELAQQIAWRPALPLGGRTVAVTRARAQTSGLAGRLRKLGARVVQAPVIHVRPIPAPNPPALDPSPYDLICLSSATGVACLFDRIARSRLDTRALAGTHVAAIGPGTAAALAEHGIIADIVPERFVAESLVEALAELPIRHALVARAREARDVLPDALRSRGVQVDVLSLYETVAEPLSAPALAAARAADYITFTSSSTVRFFLDAAGGSAELSPDTRIVSIGPVTSATLREHRLEPHVEAHSHDVEGIVEALLADAAAPVSAPLGHPRLHLRRTDSTNERARALALAGAPHGTLVSAAEQTAGRGRQGRRWSAPAGSALLMSLLLRWPISDRSPALLPLAAAVAVCDVAGSETRIKWPNDIVVPRAERVAQPAAGRPEGHALAKLAGILIEGRPQESWAVLGIGLNVAVRIDELPPELRSSAASLGRPPEAIEPLLVELLAALWRRLDEPPAQILDAWRARDALCGREVSWSASRGCAEGIDGDGRLVVRLPDGGHTALDAGEVHLALAD